MGGGQVIAALVRLNPNGSLDTSFSDDGRAPVRHNQATVSPGNQAVAVQPDGRIVMFGGAGGLFVSRYTADGRFDPSFSSDGYAEPLAGPSRAIFSAGLLQDSRFVAVGTVSDPETYRIDFLAARVLGGDDPPASETPGSRRAGPGDIADTARSRLRAGTPALGRTRLSAHCKDAR